VGQQNPSGAESKWRRIHVQNPSAESKWRRIHVFIAFLSSSSRVPPSNEFAEGCDGVSYRWKDEAHGQSRKENRKKKPKKKRHKTIDKR